MGIATLIASVAPAGLVLAQSEPQVDCTAPQTQADMTICASRDYDAADKALNTEYQSVRKILAERDSSASDDADKGAAKALLAAQRAWIAYRDANCEAVGYQARGGTLEPMLVASCLADMSRKRAEELKSLAEGF
ncbi:lysozyme inhibitor LprI family protein [Agrobacterium sp.]|jgi:uncharacterized protein YecT (DUF1311 family)|uniref:lysozyme inhibitor LprI family protein n=1 Tax=Agrobacterium sp. TaxID=361 RepID=UPI0028AAA82A|nr:lysozyme inhibitor LprI family protein [Agrobacterium sp.]